MRFLTAMLMLLSAEPIGHERAPQRIDPCPIDDALCWYRSQDRSTDFRALLNDEGMEL